MRIRLYEGRYFYDLDKKDVYIGEVKEIENEFHAPEEVIRIHNVFFKKPYNKQRDVLRLLICWAIKHYFKILFKK